MPTPSASLFDISQRVVVVTGATGVLAGSAALHFLFSNASAFVTGIVLPVDGGFSGV